VIEVNGLTKRYGAKTAVDNLSFTVRPGHVTGFLGPNGAGKTTTMRVVAWQRLTETYGPPQVADSQAQAGQLLPGLYPPLTEAWISYAAWPLVAIVLALIVVRRRDV
jgi:ABC-type polysaccharide/polyol phosphate transport system ATPase subunit